MMNIDVGLALNTGGQFAGFGELDTLGIPFADALMLLDLGSTDPKIFARVTSPNPGNPLGLILPDRTDFEFTFDGQGLTEGLVFGFRTFLQRALAGTQALANGFIGQLFDSVAADLQANRSSPLAQQLLAGNPNATINRQFLINQLLALLPQGGLSNVEANLQSAADLAQAVIKQMMDVAGKVPFNPNSLPASELSTIPGSQAASLDRSRLRASISPAATSTSPDFSPSTAVGYQSVGSYKPRANCVDHLNSGVVHGIHL